MNRIGGDERGGSVKEVRRAISVCSDFKVYQSGVRDLGTKMHGIALSVSWNKITRTKK